MSIFRWRFNDKEDFQDGIFFIFLKLKKLLKKFNFSLQVYDLQNSSRTSFYRKYLLKYSNWSSTETTLKKGEKKMILIKILF